MYFWSSLFNAYLHKIVIMSLRSCRNLCQAKKLIQWSNGIGGKHCTRQYLSVDNGDHCHHVFLNLGIFLASLKLIWLQAEECVSKAENHNSFYLSFFSFCMSLFTLIEFIMLWIFIFFGMTIHTLSSFSFQGLYTLLNYFKITSKWHSFKMIFTHYHIPLNSR